MAIVALAGAAALYWWEISGTGFGSPVFTFTSGDGREYRLSAPTSAWGTRCAELEEWTVRGRSGTSAWHTVERDCVWQAVDGGDKPFAGGVAVQVGRAHDSTDWFFFGVVPERTRMVRITLKTGAVRDLTPVGAGRLEGRVYFDYRPGIGRKIRVLGRQYLDGNGTEIHVY
jgi:hypothetical protein